jgi:hypothetical protein
MFSAELLWCLIFVQKSNFQEKSWKISQNSYFTRRLTEPEDKMETSHEGPTPPGGAGQAVPGGGVAASSTASSPPFAYISSLT